MVAQLVKEYSLNVMTCSMTDSYQRFGCFIATLKLKAARYSEMSVKFYQTRRHHIPEDRNYIFSNENLKSDGNESFRPIKCKEYL
jgi:hypothetical protein